MAQIQPQDFITRLTALRTKFAAFHTQALVEMKLGVLDITLRRPDDEQARRDFTKNYMPPDAVMDEIEAYARDIDSTYGEPETVDAVFKDESAKQKERLRQNQNLIVESDGQTLQVSANLPLPVMNWINSLRTNLETILEQYRGHLRDVRSVSHSGKTDQVTELAGLEAHLEEGIKEVFDETDRLMREHDDTATLTVLLLVFKEVGEAHQVAKVKLEGEFEEAKGEQTKDEEANEGDQAKDEQAKSEQVKVEQAKKGGQAEKGNQSEEAADRKPGEEGGGQS